MEEAAIKIGIDGSGATKTLADLRRASQDLNTELEGAEVGSEAYKKLNQQLVSTNKEIKNLELGFEALDNEQQASELGSVAGAVGDVTTAFILLGGESDTMQQIAANVEKAMGVSMAFKGAIEGVSSARKLANSLDKESTIIKIKDAIVTKAVTAGQWLLNAAMSANPIGLIIAGVAALVAAFVIFRKQIIDFISNWENLKTVLLALLGPIGWIIIAYQKLFGEEAQAEKAREKQSKANRARYEERIKQIKKERDEYVKAKDEEISALELQIDTLDAEGKATEELRLQVLEAERDKIKANIDSAREILKAKLDLFEQQARLNGKSNEEFGRSIGVDFQASVDGYQKLLNKQDESLQRAENNITRFNREQLEKRKQNQQAASDEIVEIVESEADLKAAAEAKALKEKTEAEAKAAQERAAAEAKAAQERAAAEAKLNDQIAKIREDYRISQLDSHAKEIDAVRLKYEQLLIDAEEFGLDTAELKEAQEYELAQIEDKYREEKKEKDRQAIEDKIAQQKELADKTIERANELISIVESINSIANAKEIDRIKKKQEAGEKLTKKEIKRLENQQKIEKAIAIAKIATDTAKGISAAVAAGAPLPFPANIPAIISGVSAVLAGVAQASKIINAPAVDTSSISQTSASGGLDTQGVSAEAPNTDIFNTGSTLLNAPPTKVYVLEQDISDSQNNVAAIKQQATYG
jgi:hypothetical protein